MQISTSSIYPAGPQTVPEHLTKPTPRYRLQAWIALLSLLAFVVLYLGLAYWFSHQAWTMTKLAFHDREHVFVDLVVAAISAALAVFLVKGLFSVKQGAQSGYIELRREEEPALFEFLYKLADEARAPRPHRVFLSESVNAAVFYDLSIANLLFPTRKNLLIGLALVNVLTIAEFKAVLAHEFGHFAQRSMAVGRWVYIAQQIAGHLVAQRDAFDKFINALSRVDIRVAWIGWLLQLLVWSVRSLVELGFRALLIAERALSREMEMQADLVAVSLTGSEALTHALYKLGPGEAAWNRTMGFVGEECARNRKIADVFAIQSRVLEHLRVVYDDLQYGRVPPVARGEAPARRLFKADFARPPQMWATHPLNHEREENAKRTYVDAPLDPRSAWIVFRDAAALRERASLGLYNEAAAGAPVIATAEAVEHLDGEFRREFLNRFYRGAYLGRSVVRCKAKVDDLYEPDGNLAPNVLDTIYPAILSQQLETLRDMQRERAMLKALERGTWQMAGNSAYFRGKPLRRKDLPVALAGVERELAELEERLNAHDRICRSAHLTVARAFGGGWEAYLKNLLRLMHYADHCAADLRDMQGMLSNVYQVVTAAGKVSKEKFERLHSACGDMYRCISAIYVEAPEVVPAQAVLERLGVSSWHDMIGEFRFAAPSRENINDWLRNVDSWINAAAAALDKLYEAALCELLKTEAALAKAHHTRHTGASVGVAPEPGHHPDDYPRLVPGSERKRQQTLDWWSRFQSADGTAATAAKFIVSASMVVAVLAFGAYRGRGELTLYNGFDNKVKATVDGRNIELGPRSHADIYLPAEKSDIEISASIDGLEIERFRQHLEESGSHYLYNIGQAGVFVEATAVYGGRRPPPPRYLGTPRWMALTQDDILAEPPRSISSKEGRDWRTVLIGLSERSPVEQVNSFDVRQDEAGAREKAEDLAFAHARYDAPGSANLLLWINALRDKSKVAEIVKTRLKLDPHDVMALRLEQDQDQTDAAGYAEVCARHSAMAGREPGNADLQYLKIRCMPEGRDQAQAFLDAANRWPDNPWLEQAAGYTSLERLDLADAAHRFDLAARTYPVMREWVSLDLARGRRLLDPAAKLDDLERFSEQLKAYARIDQGARGTDFDKSWTALLDGDVARAHAALPTQAGPSREEILIAASDGAKPAWGQLVLSRTPDSSWSDDGLLFAAALAMREHRDAGPYWTLLAPRQRVRSERMRQVLAGLQNGGFSRDELDTLDLVSRGQVCAMALVVRGKSAPQEWRDNAKRLLFKVERPYFD
ncbi:MAG TPA: M48 family metallopeptidase [Burkholderiaceae bacterium]